jgi:hypothetical protein
LFCLYGSEYSAVLWAIAAFCIGAGSPSLETRIRLSPVVSIVYDQWWVEKTPCVGECGLHTYCNFTFNGITFLGIEWCSKCRPRQAD